MMRALVIAALALAVLAALLLAGNAWANARVWNARVEIRDEKIPAAFDGFVLCQVSDVHNEARGEGNAALLRALRPEATRLFVGAPEPACSPYEGVWAAEADGVQPLLFVNPRSMEVERFMRSCGLGRPEGTNEPLDHVATECELLERLALRAAGAPASEGAPDGAGLPGGSPAAAYETFLSGHAQAWMPAFAERLAAEARHPFYRAAAAYLGALVG